MNKQRIRYIIALMSIALIGIICLQVYWISHDIKLKENQFEQTVNQAMTAIVDKIETREAFAIMNKRLINIDPGHVTNILIRDSSLAPAFTVNDTEILVSRPVGTPAQLFDDLDNADLRVEFHRPGSNRAIFRYQHKNFFLKDSVSTRHIRSSQLTKIDNDSAEVVIRRNEEKVKARVEKMQQLMDQWAREFVGSEQDTRSRVSPGELDTIITTELQNRGIRLNCEYGVVRGDTKQLLMSNCDKECANNFYSSRFKTQLFPNDIFAKPDYLVMNFPNSMKYVLSSMWLMLASSSIFTLIILFVFAYTIQVIIRQKKLSDIKSDFINNMTHEFKTPIATISLAVDSIKNPRVHHDPGKMDYFTRIIREENKRMNTQVEHVLQMAQIEKGELHLRKEEVNLHDLIVQAVELIRLQVESREGSLNLFLNAERPVISGDAFHLSNVITNLLDNANKYSREKPDITLKTEDFKGGILVTVTDKGIGMSKETQKNIFEKFYRVPTGNLHDIKGFGLGLSYVKAIVEAHQGWITVDSEPGRGSTFQMFLP